MPVTCAAYGLTGQQLHGRLSLDNVGVSERSLVDEKPVPRACTCLDETTAGTVRAMTSSREAGGGDETSERLGRAGRRVEEKVGYRLAMDLEDRVRRSAEIRDD